MLAYRLEQEAPGSPPPPLLLSILFPLPETRNERAPFTYLSLELVAPIPRVHWVTAGVCSFPAVRRH